MRLYTLPTTRCTTSASGSSQRWPRMTPSTSSSVTRAPPNRRPGLSRSGDFASNGFAMISPLTGQVLVVVDALAQPRTGPRLIARWGARVRRLGVGEAPIGLSKGRPVQGMARSVASGEQRSRAATPSAVRCRRCQEQSGLIDCSMPTALMSMSRYAPRVSAVDGIPIAAKRLASVGRLSSAARMP
jgi:hypothetical protein